MKHVWFVVSIISLIAGIHKTWLFGFKESYLFFIFAVIAFLMYLLRKNMSASDKKSKS
jgi:flagellar biogenesis protein FliO